MSCQARTDLSAGDGPPEFLLADRRASGKLPTRNQGSERFGNLGNGLDPLKRPAPRQREVTALTHGIRRQRDGRARLMSCEPPHDMKDDALLAI
jgi:hypothetical protein